MGLFYIKVLISCFINTQKSVHAHRLEFINKNEAQLLQ